MDIQVLYRNLVSAAPAGNQFVFRFTGLPIWRNDGAQLLHLGISARYQEDEQGELLYRGRPGSNVTDFYMDGGSFDTVYAISKGLEALLQSNKVTVLGEQFKS